MGFFLYVLALWSVYYLINHASLFDRLRAAAMPVLPQWLQKLVSCSYCLTFWITAAFSLFTGFSVVLLAAPPCTLFLELGYRKLSGEPVVQPEPPILSK